MQEKPAYEQDHGLQGPPRLLLFAVIGLFVLALLGTTAGIFVFRNVLRPGQQQRVVQILPFMDALRPRYESETGRVPTAIAPTSESGLSAMDLLAAPLSTSPEVTAETTPQPTEAVILMPTATLTPSATPTPEVTTVPTEAAVIPTEAAFAVEPTFNVSMSVSLPPSQRLYGFTYVKQSWNNCGPANITQALSYYGWVESMEYAASYIKPDAEDRNVSPNELVSFVNEQSQVRALSRIGGSLNDLKRFIANGFPVVIETGYFYEGSDWLGHYQTIVGYDDAQRSLFVYDSYLGPDLQVEYTSFDYEWSAFNRVFIVLYRPDQETQVRDLLGPLADPASAAAIALDAARTEAAANPQNGYAWFNMGSALTRLERYDEAAVAFDQARVAGIPWRMTWYQFGMFEAYFNVGRYDDVLALVETNVANSQPYVVEETYYWQGRVFETRGEAQSAAEAFSLALSRNPRYQTARDALNALNL